jgi:hypothetical protein
MKAINKFFGTASLFTTFSVIYASFLIISIPCAFIFVLPDSLDLIQILIVCTISLLFAGMLAFINNMFNLSSVFWKYFTYVKYLIENAETKDEIQSIYDNEFQDLVKMQMGNPHNTMIVELYSILKKKYKYVK